MTFSKTVLAAAASACLVAISCLPASAAPVSAAGTQLVAQSSAVQLAGHKHSHKKFKKLKKKKHHRHHKHHKGKHHH